VKVGRAALDDDAKRRIEALNPEVEFDWPRILKGAPGAEARPPATRERDDTRRQRPPDSRTPSNSPRTGRSGRGAPPPPPAQAAQPPPGPAAESDAQVKARVEPVAEVPRTVEVPALPTHTGTPAHARLGDEGVQRLRARYAELLAAVAERAPDPARGTELKATAERLNPDAWHTDDEVVQGLELYETVFASLREVVGRTRRKRRRNLEEPQAPQPEVDSASAATVPVGEDAPEMGSDSDASDPGRTDDDRDDSGSGGP
jgi:hypothetical protein